MKDYYLIMCTNHFSFTVKARNEDKAKLKAIKVIKRRYNGNYEIKTIKILHIGRIIQIINKRWKNEN